MQIVQTYLYDNTVVVQIDADPDISTEYRVVYTRTLTAYQGVDNVLKIKVMNADQKPVNISDYTLTFNVVDDYVYTNANVVLSTNVTVSNANLGLGSVTLTSTDLQQLARNWYKFNVKFNNGSGNIAGYVDDNYGAAGDLELVRSAYPTNPVTFDLGIIGDGSDSFVADFGNI
jgi:hypothetical protein